MGPIIGARRKTQSPRWGGQYWDDDLGLYYTGSNWYSPDLGRATTGGFIAGLALGNTAGHAPPAYIGGGYWGGAGRGYQGGAYQWHRHAAADGGNDVLIPDHNIDLPPEWQNPLDYTDQTDYSDQQCSAADFGREGKSTIAPPAEIGADPSFGSNQHAGLIITESSPWQLPLPEPSYHLDPNSNPSIINLTPGIINLTPDPNQDTRPYRCPIDYERLERERLLRAATLIGPTSFISYYSGSTWDTGYRDPYFWDGSEKLRWCRIGIYRDGYINAHSMVVVQRSNGTFCQMGYMPPRGWVGMGVFQGQQIIGAEQDPTTKPDTRIIAETWIPADEANAAAEWLASLGGQTAPGATMIPGWNCIPYADRMYDACTAGQGYPDYWHMLNNTAGGHLLGLW